jgi:hypothetical protein
MSATGTAGSGGHSHIWSGPFSDVECTPGREWTDADGKTWVEIEDGNGGVTGVPPTELFTLAAWRAKQAKAGQKPSPAATNALAITWAATSHVEADRMPIGKVYSQTGKWGVTAAVQRPGAANTYAFEPVVYRGLEEMADDTARRIQSECWTMVAGAPRPELDLTLLHRRIRSNFIDAPTTTFIIDVDGMVPGKGKDLSRPEHFDDDVVDVFRARLKKAGIHSLATAKLILLATASTGFAHNSKGEPARGCARFRVILQFSTPLTLGQQKALTAALGKLRGFESLDPAKVSCLDTDICTVSGNIFVAPAQGIDDPIKDRVWTFDAEDGDGVVDVDQLTAELKLAEVPPVEPEAPRKPKGERVMQAPPEKREALLSALVKALPNEPGFDRNKWVGVAHAIWGAADGEDWAYDVWTEWSLRWPGGDDPLDRERTWNSLPEGDNGIGYLLGWAHNVGTPEALAAVQAIELALFDRIDDDDDNDDDDDPPLPPPPAADRWEELKRALQWPGKARIRRKENITRRFRGVASFGKDAMPGNASERAWITNRHIRGVVSEMNGMPGGGKSGLAVAYANAIAAEKPELAGLSKIERCGAVVIVAADGERADEFKRKDEAFRALHGLTNADYRHSLHVVEDTGPFTEKVGAVWVPSRWIIALAGFLAELREKEKLATVFVDTLLGVSGAGNTAEAIDMQPLLEVVKLMISELDCSVEILNHFTKGGAKDPASMDAGLGARPMTATPRFVTNLSNAAGGLVKVEMPKASYLGGPVGASIFEWKSIPIPVNVFDVDGAFTGTRTEEIGVLMPSTQLALRQMKEDAAYEALRKAAASGMKIIRTKPGGRAEPDHASAIIKEAVDLKTTAEVEAMIETLIRQGRITQTTVKRDPVRKRQVEAITVNEPEPDPI